MTLCALKMASSFWKALVLVGLLALAHAAFSAAQHRSYMRLTEKENETLPIDIVLQTLLAFIVTCYGIVHIAGEFKDMDASAELKNKSFPDKNMRNSECITDIFHPQTFDTLRNRPSFYLFNHRGRILSHSPDQASFIPCARALPVNPVRLRKLDPLHH